MADRGDIYMWGSEPNMEQGNATETQPPPSNMTGHAGIQSTHPPIVNGSPKDMKEGLGNGDHMHMYGDYSKWAHWLKEAHMNPQPQSPATLHPPHHPSSMFTSMPGPSTPLPGPQMTVHHTPKVPTINSVTSSSGDIPSTNTPLVIPQPVRNPKPATKTYHCRMCNQIFNSKSDLLVHSHQVHKQDPKPYKCPTCNKCFANSSYLSQHARIHAGIKPYKCQICERRFTQLCHLQQHIRTHTGEKPYKCQHPGCGKAFSQLSNLQSHSRSHMTDKPFRCNSCYKCYADEQSLREHIPKHSETKHLKTHICHICGKSYTQETYLTRHMAKHSGEGNNNVRTSSYQRQASAPAALMSSVSSSNIATPHPDVYDMKPGSMNNMSMPGMGECSKGSAFVPLSQPFATSPSSVPSMVPFNPAHLAANNISPTLQHFSAPPGVASSRYFPFDPMPFTHKRDAMDRSLSSPRDLMPNHLLSLQDIKNYSLYHQMTLKQEPDSPMHKDGHYTQLGK